MVILTVEHLYKMIKSKVENEKINETPQEQEETTEIVEPTEERKIEFPTPTYWNWMMQIHYDKRSPSKIMRIDFVLKM